MTYTLLKSVTPIDFSRYEFSSYARNGVSLYEVQGLPFYLLGVEDSGKNIKRELEHETAQEIAYAEFAPAAMKTIFGHYLSKAQLMSVVFSDRDISEEANELLLGIQSCWNVAPSQQKKEELLALFDDVQEESGDQLWYLVLRINQNQINVYPSSAIICTSSDEQAFAVAQELLELLSGSSPTLLRIELKEKPKKLDPLEKSKQTLALLFENHGEETRLALGIPEEEFEDMKKSLLS